MTSSNAPAWTPTLRVASGVSALFKKSKVRKFFGIDCIVCICPQAAHRKVTNKLTQIHPEQGNGGGLNLGKHNFKHDQGSNAPSTSAFHQLNNEFLMYIQYWICIPRVLYLHRGESAELLKLRELLGPLCTRASDMQIRRFFMFWRFKTAINSIISSIFY